MSLEVVFSMNSRNIFISSLFIVLLSFILVSITNRTYSIDSQNVIYVEDLKVGDFVPFGTKLIISDNYHCYSGLSDGKNCDYVSFLFFDKTLDVKYSYRVDSVSKEYLARSYYDYFAEDTDFIGWIFDGFGSNVELSFIPVSSYSSIIEEPEVDNNFLISADCISTNKTTYSWYFVKNINDYSVYSFDNKLIKNVNGNNLFFEEGLDSNIDSDDLIVSYDVDVSKGDIIEFETRGGTRYCNLVEKCREKVFDLIEHDISIYESSLYNDNSITFNKDLDVLSFRLTGEYGYIRNMKVLTLINEGNQLDLSKVGKGDIVISKATCGDGYHMYSVPLIIDENYNFANNPNTSVFLSYLLIVGLVLFILNLLLRKMMNKSN